MPDVEIHARYFIMKYSCWQWPKSALYGSLGSQSSSTIATKCLVEKQDSWMIEWYVPFFSCKTTDGSISEFSAQDILLSHGNLLQERNAENYKISLHMFSVVQGQTMIFFGLSNGGRCDKRISSSWGLNIYNWVVQSSDLWSFHEVKFNENKLAF